MYILGLLILIKMLIPNPYYPVIDKPRQEYDVFQVFNGYKNNTVAVVPNSTETNVSFILYT